MADWVWWFVLAGAALVAELLTGTFYLLVIAAALAAGGAVSLAGAAFAWQLLATVVVAFGGALALRRIRPRHGGADAAAPLQNLDVGQTVHVEQWSAARTARASYRGALWDVELAPGEEPQAGEFVIRAIRGNRLIVARRRH
jgi:membrane protein implicated in regulation of membrane protease activity